MSTKTEGTVQIVKTVEECKVLLEGKVNVGALSDEQIVSVARAMAPAGVKVAIAKPSRLVVGEYKGNAMITIEGDHRPFSFGKSKALLLRDNWAALEALIADTFDK